MKILLAIATLLSFQVANAKATVNSVKIQFSRLCGENVSCQQDAFSIPEDATCQELRDYMLRHGIRLTNANDISEVVDCKASRD